MGLGNRESSVYLSVAGGKVIRRFNEPQPGTKPRISKTGKQVHEAAYDFIAGTITDIEVRDTEFGKFWQVSLADDGVTYKLQFNYSGGNASSFLKALPNVNPAIPVTIIPRVKLEGDKTRSSIIMLQQDKVIRWAWTKDNPGELPQLRKIKIKGVEQWDDSDMMEYLESFVKHEYMPRVRLNKQATMASAAFGAEVPDAEEDTPF